MSGLQMMTAATIAGALVFGMTLALFGSLKRAVSRRVSLADVPMRGLLISLNVALIPMVLLCGVVADIYGARLVLVAGSVLLAVALVSLSIRPASPRTFASVFLAAFGAAAVGTASTVLMPQAFFAPAETSASVNLGYVFIALGALLTSVLTDLLLAVLQVRRTLGILALFSLVPAFLAVFASAGAGQAADQSGDAATMLSEQSIWLAALVFLFYAPLEAAVSLWTFTLLRERQRPEREAVGLLAGFWAAFLGSRLLVTLARHADWMSEGWDRWLIVVPPLLAAVVLGNLAGASHRGLPRAGLILLGLLLGPVAPTLVGTIFRHVAAAEQGLAYGVVFAAGSLGCLLLSPALTPRTRPPLQTALRMPIFLALLLTAAALVLGLMTP